jgi:hypothetical protein
MRGSQPSRNQRSEIVRTNDKIAFVALRYYKNADRACCDPPGSESMTNRLQEARRGAPDALPARIAEI